MCKNFEEVLDLGFLGHSCFSELLTLTSVVRYLECITRGELLSTMVAVCWDYLGTGQKTFLKTHTNQLSEQTIKHCFCPR